MELRNLKKAFWISKKDLKIYYSKGPVLIFGLMIPAFFFLAFSLGRDMSPIFLSSGLIGMTLWFTSTSISPVITPWETWDKTLERLLTMPISVTGIILGDIIASSILGLLITGITITALVFLLEITLNNILLYFISLIAASICFSSIGSLIGAYPTDRTADVMMIATTIKFPIIFISGIFIPLEELPTIGKWISYLSPLTYFVEVSKNTFGGHIEYIPIILISILAPIFLSLAILIHKFTIPRRI